MKRVCAQVRAPADLNNAIPNQEATIARRLTKLLPGVFDHYALGDRVDSSEPMSRNNFPTVFSLEK